MKSARSARKKRHRPLSAPAGAVQKKGASNLPAVQQPHNWWKWTSAAVLVGAILIRLLDLTVKPLHHDEGVNGGFMVNLFRNGFYRYDPSNYHGPSLYYSALITTTLNSLVYGRFGLSTFAIRVVPALFGIATVWLLLLLRRPLGAIAAIAAAALLACSPANVFFSRYFIHEVPFVFLTLAVVVAFLRYSEHHKTRDLMLGSASAALLFATKETSVISFAVLLLAWLCMRGYLMLRQRPAPGRRLPAEANPLDTRIRLYAIAAGLFIVINICLYSSFFTNFPQGVYDSIRTYGFWASTGTSKYLSDWSTYFQWLKKEELPILVLGASGIVVALFKARHRFAVFAAFWALGISAAYSLIPYKTPWLILNLVLPLAIMAGYGVERWYTSGVVHGSRMLRISAVATLLVALAWSGYQAIELSFFRYDDDSIPYVYAHTRREFLSMINEINSVAAHNGRDSQLGIVVMSPEYWPLPWYLRDYSNVGYWGKVIQTAEPVVVAADYQSEEVEQKVGTLYRQFGSYDLRPGVRLVLYLRRDQQP